VLPFEPLLQKLLGELKVPEVFKTVPLGLEREYEVCTAAVAGLAAVAESRLPLAES
jgi:hypothetical protein